MSDNYISEIKPSPAGYYIKYGGEWYSYLRRSKTILASVMYADVVPKFSKKYKLISNYIKAYERLTQ